ncbi:hypothetical protein MRX96_017733 [Rhipicephalus microplus]
MMTTSFPLLDSFNRLNTFDDFAIDKHVVNRILRPANLFSSPQFLNIALENITHVTKSTEFLVKGRRIFSMTSLAATKETAPRRGFFFYSAWPSLSRKPAYMYQWIRDVMVPHIVLNYLGFREVVAASPFLPSKLQALSALGRSPALRKEICLGVIAESLPVMSLYAGFNAFKQGLRDFKAANVTGATKAAVSSLVKKIDWMDGATKARVSKKVPMVTENEGLRSYATIRKALFENTLKTEAAHMDERQGQDTMVMTIVSRKCHMLATTCMMHLPDTLPKISRCLVSQILREGAGDHVSPYSQATWSDVTKKHFKDTRQCFTKQLSETASQNASEAIYKQFVSQKNIDRKSFVKVFNIDVDQFFFVSYASQKKNQSTISRTALFDDAAVNPTGLVDVVVHYLAGLPGEGQVPPVKHAEELSFVQLYLCPPRKIKSTRHAVLQSRPGDARTVESCNMS